MEIKEEISNFEPNFTHHDTKYERLQYLTNPEKFKADIEKVFRNAK